MIILTLRTDKPEAELSLYDDEQQLAHISWTAHRQLAETLHSQIASLLQKQGKDWAAVQGIVCFAGPGSFTGLRIGLSVANALAYSLGIQIVAMRGEAWAKDGQKRLARGESDKVAVPEYGAGVHITAPRK